MRRHSDDLVREIQDMRNIEWSSVRNSSGTNGCFLKANMGEDSQKIYYKLSNYDSVRGIFGHESVNELIVSRLLDVLEIPHVQYRLIHARVLVEDQEYTTWLCSSPNFRKRGKRKMALDSYYAMHKLPKESLFDFCKRYGVLQDVYNMILVDFLIINRDRHGANIEVLVDGSGNFRLAPLFDHGVSFVSPYFDAESAVVEFDAMQNKPVNNYFGSRFLFENLKLLPEDMRIPVFTEDDLQYIFRGLDEVLPSTYILKMREILTRRCAYYEDLRHRE